ncbi:MAG: ABC transporter permease [Elusimicrobia bacterium]|nr:ABC transporter permease [Elusimicrobiota bacterium]
MARRRRQAGPGVSRPARLDWPALGWQAVFLGVPLALIAAVSVASRGPYGTLEWGLGLDAYRRLLDPLYCSVFARSLALAGLNTILCAVLAYPIAYWIARAPRKKQGLLVLLVLIPFWTNVLVRLYAWMFILGRAGPLNAMLQAAGLAQEPVEVLFTPGAVVLGLVYEHLPFMILPLYATLEKIDWALVDAARDLYATPAQAFWRVTLPLSRPGLAAGSILVFVWTLGDFVTPDILGGSKIVMAGNLIHQQYLVLRDWPFGSALSFGLMAVVGAGLALARRAEAVR